ncbi:MAG: transposase [Okeania sp. SIO2C2]|uniref:zinc ribbon domain-containing protein n=1 Tax=Okeania sp. SIO2C2 TaxID=2607787 RepID=UPI0013B8855C|nr:zinc ribbon domain-containing protein [Okeania sp. SIO2C2]NEP41866.1 transposase [Okeania sp. SIO2H7]NEP86233.1 transposase [Okeania sp. SIO2C2]
MTLCTVRFCAITSINESLSIVAVSMELEYKCQWYCSELVVVDRFFPSSKTCCRCGHVQDMPLSLRTYDCPDCGLSIDRDLNASINLRNAVGLIVNACGRSAADSSGGLRSIP